MEGPIPEPKQTIVYPLFINQYFNENEFVVRKVRDWAILKEKECCMMNETFDNFKTNWSRKLVIIKDCGRCFCQKLAVRYICPIVPQYTFHERITHIQTWRSPDIHLAFPDFHLTFTWPFPDPYLTLISSLQLTVYSSKKVIWSQTLSQGPLLMFCKLVQELTMRGSERGTWAWQQIFWQALLSIWNSHFFVFWWLLKWIRNSIIWGDYLR